jgi:hypothetical protein
MLFVVVDHTKLKDKEYGLVLNDLLYKKIRPNTPLANARSICGLKRWVKSENGIAFGYDILARVLCQPFCFVGGIERQFSG